MKKLSSYSLKLVDIKPLTLGAGAGDLHTLHKTRACNTTNNADVHSRGGKIFIITCSKQKIYILKVILRQLG